MMKKQQKQDEQKKTTKNKELRRTRMQAIVRGARRLETGMRSALANDEEEEQQKFQNIKTQIDALPQAQRQARRKTLGFFSQVFTKSKAWMTYYESKIGVNRVDRDDITYDDKKLPEAIKNCNEDVAQIKAYFTLVKKINSDLKVDEAALDLGSISIGNSPKKPTRV